MRSFPCAVVCIVLLCVPTGALGQWTDDAAALRTPGPVVRSGDLFRVELIAFEPIHGPFIVQLTYRFSQRVIVEDEDGNQREATRARTIVRPPMPGIEAIGAGQVLLVDDTFRFGDESTAGRYEVEAAISGPGGVRFNAIRACVSYQPEKVLPAGGSGDHAPPDACEFSIAGVQRSEGGGWVTLHGRLPELGVYRALLLDQQTLLARLDSGVNRTGPSTLDIVSPLLPELAGRAVDLVVHDARTNRSATLSRLTLPPGR